MTSWEFTYIYIIKKCLLPKPRYSSLILPPLISPRPLFHSTSYESLGANAALTRHWRSGIIHQKVGHCLVIELLGIGSLGY